jgi:hypothetical protein
LYFGGETGKVRFFSYVQYDLPTHSAGPSTFNMTAIGHGTVFLLKNLSLPHHFEAQKKNTEVIHGYIIKFWRNARNPRPQNLKTVDHEWFAYLV